jgi:LytS/YehU family sensor histidine kinase
VLDPGALGLLLVLFLVGGWGLGRDIDLEQGIESAERRAERAALDTERARVLAMRAQLDPHFLFNTLNAIAEWCRQDPALAERATLQLAAMLRAILDGSTQPSWPLAREVALLEQLTALYAVRDPERYRFVLRVPQPIPDVEVPPMLLLPLLENAITHGPAAGHAGEVVVSIGVHDGAVELVITNPGAFAGRREGGHGIAMVEKRLELAYAGAARLTLRAVESTTRTEVSMPLAPMAAEALAS